MLDAVIFDMDGLLVDSEPLWRRAEIEIFGAVGVVLTDAQCAETTGLRVDEVVRFRHAQKPWSAPSVEAITNAIVARTIELISAEAEPLPGVSHALSIARGTGARLALASSSPRRLIDATLARLGMTRAFEVVASAESEAEGKPHPAVYLTTARLLGVAPGDCTAIEDSLRGVQAAKAAGMRCVAVPERDQGSFTGVADVVLRSLGELTESMLRGAHARP